MKTNARSGRLGKAVKVLVVTMLAGLIILLLFLRGISIPSAKLPPEGRTESVISRARHILEGFSISVRLGYLKERKIFRDLLLDLVNQYGKPDEVILEFVRDGADNSLFGQEKARAITNNIKNNEKHNQEIKTKLEEQNVYSPTNFEKYKLLEMQRSICVYSGKMIGISDLDKCEIDHIYPRTMGGNDALYNKVLCYREENHKKKGRTPYEWLASDEKEWAKYIFRLNELKSSLGKKKFELLTSPPETCAKLIESYNALAETSHIARVAQQLIALVFGWQLQAEGEKRHIFVNNGYPNPICTYDKMTKNVEINKK